MSQRSKPRGEEIGQALGRIEEIESIAGRWCVDDDEVVLPLGMDLVQPFHGDVVVRLHESPGDVLVERVGQYLLPGRRIGSMAVDEVVPALFGVEHGRPQLAAGRGTRLLEHLVGYAHLPVADALES